MNVQYLIQILTNKLTILGNAKIQSFNAGDIDAISKIEEEILGVENTLSQLRLLQTLDTVATTANTTPAEVVNTGVDTLQNPVQGPSADAVINGYDVSAYATDALYEIKIKNILASMPAFATTYDVDLYLINTAPTTPLLGSMIAQAVNQYPVDISLLLAIMQNDSLFGTLGVGARTNNPGNVGNTGTETRTYPSWQDGVTAVAEWLSRHHAVAIAVEAIKNNLVVSGPTTSTIPTILTTPTSTLPIMLIAPTSTAPILFTTATSTPAVNVPTSTPDSIPLPIITPPSFQSSTPSVIDPVVTSTPPVEPPTSTLQQIIENIISPSSTPPVASSTIDAVVESVPSTTVDIVSTTPVEVADVASTTP